MSAPDASEGLQIDSLELIRHLLQGEIREQIAALYEAVPTLDQNLHLPIVGLRENLSRIGTIIDQTLDRPDDAQSIRKEADKVLRMLAASASAHDDEKFFRFAVRTLAEFYHCRYAFIGRLQEDGEHVRTLAVYAGDKIADDFEYELAGTPCQDVLRFNKELTPTNASEIYSDDEMLVQMGVDSYFGAPIVSQDNKMIGILAVMDTEPMELNEWTAPLLGSFAARLAVEIERKEAFDELAVLTATLEQRVEERTAELTAEVEERRRIEIQRERLVRRLRRSNHDLAGFAHTVSHDLRSPLLTIRGYLSLIGRAAERGDTERLDHDLKRCDEATVRMNSLLTDLLDLAKLDDPKMKYEKLSLAVPAQEAVDLLAAQIRESGAAVKIAPGLPDVDGVRTSLRQLFQNLLDNAIKFIGDRPDPRIEIGMRDGEIPVFFVRDNGSGIAPEEHELIFSLFGRLHQETQGRGIGLTIVRRVVENHGGRVWVESEGPGCGAAFCFTLAEPSFPSEEDAEAA